jgi:hypothetical protein
LYPPGESSGRYGLCWRDVDGTKVAGITRALMAIKRDGLFWIAYFKGGKKAGS